MQLRVCHYDEDSDIITAVYVDGQQTASVAPRSRQLLIPMQPCVPG